VVWVAIAEPLLVLGVVVKTFEMVVRVLTLVEERTDPVLGDVLAQVAHVFMLYQAPSAVHLRVVVETVLQIVAVLLVTSIYLKVKQVEVLDLPLALLG
jgi:hypothetical protein